MSSVKKRNSAAIKKLVNKGFTPKQISKKTGLCVWTVYRHIRDLGLSKKTTVSQRERELKEIKKLLDSGLTPRETALKMGRSDMHIYRAMKKLGTNKGVTSVRFLCKQHGVSVDSVNSLRTRKGMTLEEAIEAAKTTIKIKWKYEGYEGLPAIAEGLGLNFHSLSYTVHHLGVKDIEDAIAIVKSKQRKPVTNKPVINPSWKLALGIRA